MKWHILIILVGLCPITMGFSAMEMSADELSMQKLILESLYRPSSNGYPRNITVIANDTVQLICPIGFDNGVTINVTWFKLSNFTMTGSHFGIVFNDYNNKTYEPVGEAVKDHTNKSYQLTLSNVSKYQEGWYQCIFDDTLQNSHNSLLYKTYLTVLENVSLKDNMLLKQYIILVNETYPPEEQTVGITLLWKDELGHAAAELLRIVLTSSGYNFDFIKVDSYNSEDIIPLTTLTFIVEEMDVYFQAKLSSRAKRISCELNNRSFYKDFKRLEQCDFRFTFDENNRLIRIYTEEGLDFYFAKRLIETRLLLKNVDIIFENRLELANMIRNSNMSFFFLDTYLQNNMTNIRLIEVPPLLEKESNITRSKTKFFVKVNEIEENNNELHNINFFPYLSDLYGIIDEFKSISGRDMQEAAVRWFLKCAGYRERRERFSYWQRKFSLQPEESIGKVAIIICESEALDFTNYIQMIQLLVFHYEDLASISTVIKPRFPWNLFLQVIITDCVKTDWFFNTLNNWIKHHAIYKTKGVIVTNKLAVPAAYLANLNDVPLFIYDVPSADLKKYQRIYSATGSVEHLALALRRLLADCRWQRLAIISDGTDFAAALLAALQASTMRLTVRNINITSRTSEIVLTLQDLLQASSRVFLVNTEAATAAAILSAANELNMAHDNGFAWIVREYNAADNATSATKPISVSYFWRGENVIQADIEETLANCWDTSIMDPSDKDCLIRRKNLIRLQLNDIWQNRAWPVYAAPLLYILQNIFQNILQNYFQNPIQNIFQSNLTELILLSDKSEYKEFYTIKDRLIYVQLWGSEPRPRLLATWREGEHRKPDESCPMTNPPPDGSFTCLLPSGDPFQPSCHDAMWITLAVFGLIFTVVIIYWSRKAVIAYKIRTETNLTKRLLARRERVFEALVDHIIDRTDLKLLQELGSGRFGRVHNGILRVTASGRTNILVAVKVLREDATSAEECEFLREACTLATLDHENIIRFMGVCVLDGPPLLLMEHAFFGDLSKYLKARRCLFEQPKNRANCFPGDEKVHVSVEALTALACEAATALAYLAERGIVHRDLRASNCLLDENRSLKVGDFGLARATGTDCDEYQMSRRGMVPVLWMAPESLARGVSSAASDVWSLGVLVSELVTLGRRPYGVQPPAVVLRHVLAGGQPQLPWDASADTRALTRACWRREPEARPPAARLAAWLRAHPAALRPALVEELVYIDKLIDGQDIDDLFSTDTIQMSTLARPSLSSDQP